MPVLDVQARVQNNKIEYMFYKKPVSSEYFMLANSAMPQTVKRSACVQEVLRRLRNTKRELPWKLKAEIISKFSNSLRISGYNEKFRMEVIQSAVRGSEAQCDRADRGEVPLHRPRSFERGAEGHH